MDSFSIQIPIGAYDKLLKQHLLSQSLEEALSCVLHGTE
jgi:hypothetical protein